MNQKKDITLQDHIRYVMNTKPLTKEEVAELKTGTPVLMQRKNSHLSGGIVEIDDEYIESRTIFEAEHPGTLIAQKPGNRHNLRLAANVWVLDMEILTKAFPKRTAQTLELIKEPVATT